MSKALEVLKQNVTIMGELEYVVREIDSRFCAVEMATPEKVPFRMFYYIVDLVDEKVFYGDYAIPDMVTTRRILNGLEQNTSA